LENWLKISKSKLRGPTGGASWLRRRQPARPCFHDTPPYIYRPDKTVSPRTLVLSRFRPANFFHGRSGRRHRLPTTRLRRFSRSTLCPKLSFDNSPKNSKSKLRAPEAPRGCGGGNRPALASTTHLPTYIGLTKPCRPTPCFRNGGALGESAAVRKLPDGFSNFFFCRKAIERGYLFLVGHFSEKVARKKVISQAGGGRLRPQEPDGRTEPKLTKNAKVPGGPNPPVSQGKPTQRIEKIQ